MEFLVLTLKKYVIIIKKLDFSFTFQTSCMIVHSVQIHTSRYLI